MSYFLAPVAKKQFAEVNARFPNRDKSSDGWIGDPSHAARKSEHNPCWTCVGKNYGIVLATDIDIDDRDSSEDLRKLLIKEMVGDPRVWYLISNGIIYSRTYGWRARKYTGANAHFKHVHTSFRLETSWDVRPFFSEGAKTPVLNKTVPAYLDISNVVDEFLRVIHKKRAARFSIDVRRFQRLANVRIGSNLNLDGEVGPKTISAAAKLESKFGGTGRPRVPDATVLARANKGMFRLVA